MSEPLTAEEVALQHRGLCGRLFTSDGEDYYCLRMPHSEQPGRHADSEVLRLPAKRKEHSHERAP